MNENDEGEKRETANTTNGSMITEREREMDKGGEWVETTLGE